MPIKHCQRNIWLIKPSNMNQGKGIELFNSLKEIELSFATKPHNTQWVVQKYIEKPLLINNRKFDIRVWVLYMPRKIFVYYKPYFRTCSSLYDINNIANN